MNVEISKLNKPEIGEVSELLAKSMCTNPNHLAMFRSSNRSVVKKQQRMFEMVLKNPDNKCFTARLDGAIVGVMCYSSSEKCQMNPLQMLVSFPRFIGIFGKYLFPVLKWRMKWAKHDCQTKHIHFGPLAVHSDFQGKGIGKALLTNFCEFLDITNQTAYLETDKEENVALYEKFDFKTVETDTLFGNTNWFMLRKNKH
ncbi:MAG: Acetyltransferase family protein [Fluviicola sp.]|jgi:ribosomal protein S18 acetylase RimI-like enzyme|uniref:GNAT family N-acetyltransferase n=1 Tax=Fluviicola sp. TaxID=1917219 RepID=UPI002621183C|nr:GNAT family N-acetyltransferase [Fluviicola sp.]MDF3026021.1 Acetyltransferase family protein [Fluviicola sp.]